MKKFKFKWDGEYTEAVRPAFCYGPIPVQTWSWKRGISLQDWRFAVKIPSKTIDKLVRGMVRGAMI